MIHTIMEKLNMTWHEVMWKRSWINIQMMLADSSKLVKKYPGGIPTLSGKEMAARHRAKKGNG